MYPFFESIRVEDSRISLPELHQQRIRNTYRAFGRDGSPDIEKIFKNLKADKQGLFKLRVSYDLEGNFKAILLPYTISEIHQIRLVINNGIDYAFKYEDRSALEKMKSGAEEVIIVKDGHITDTTFSNLLFLKGKIWYTPTTFLLNGVQRQHLLNTKKIREMEITVKNISQFSHFQIINAMNNFGDTSVYPLSLIKNLGEAPDLGIRVAVF